MSTKLTHEFLIKRRSVGPGKEQAEMSLLITLLSGICELSTLPDALKYELPTAGVRAGGGGGGGGWGGGGAGGGGGGGGGGWG